MLYKPNFCCSCGEKIKRAEWRILTSRRFCEVCAVENQGHEWLVRGVLATGVLLGLFGIGSLIRPVEPQRAVRLAPASAETSQASSVREPQTVTLPTESRTAPMLNNVTPEVSLRPEIGGPIGSKEQLRRQTGASDEAVLYCGAMTKKGAPCSRRVKSKGRCWQHEGRPSMLETQPAGDMY